MRGSRRLGIAPDGEIVVVVSRLEGCQLFKFRRCLLQMKKELVRKKIEVAVFALVPTVYAAVISIADAIETGRIGHRKRLQEDSLH